MLSKPVWLETAMVAVQGVTDVTAERFIELSVGSTAETGRAKPEGQMWAKA